MRPQTFFPRFIALNFAHKFSIRIISLARPVTQVVVRADSRHAALPPHNTSMLLAAAGSYICLCSVAHTIHHRHTRCLIRCHSTLLAHWYQEKPNRKLPTKEYPLALPGRGKRVPVLYIHHSAKTTDDDDDDTVRCETVRNFLSRSAILFTHTSHARHHTTIPRFPARKSDRLQLRKQKPVCLFPVTGYELE